MTGAPAPRHLKCVLLGETGVGKSSLAFRWAHKAAPPRDGGATIGASFVPLRTADGAHVDVWDTAGQERYRSLAPMYVRGAHVAVLVSDATAPRRGPGAGANAANTFAEWRDLVERSGAVAVHATNKSDLLYGAAPGPSGGDSPGAPIFVSARTGDGADELLGRVVELAREADALRPREAVVRSLSVDAPPAAAAGCCR